MDDSQTMPEVTEQNMARIFGPESPKIYIAQGLAALALSWLDAVLLSYVGYHLVKQDPRWTEEYQGEVWFVQKREHVAHYLGVTVTALEKSITRLRMKKLLVTAAVGPYRKLLWRVNIDNILKSIMPESSLEPSRKAVWDDPGKLSGLDLYNKTEIQNIRPLQIKR